MGKVIIKSNYRQINWTKFRKWITRGEFVYFRSSIDTGSSRTRRIQLIIFNFIKKVFLFELTSKTLQWSFALEGWVFIDLFEFTSVRNNFFNSLLFILFNWRKPNLNAQKNHLALTLSLLFLFPLLLSAFICFSFFCFFAFLFHLLFSLSLR